MRLGPRTSLLQCPPPGHRGGPMKASPPVSAAMRTTRTNNRRESDSFSLKMSPPTAPDHFVVGEASRGPSGACGQSPAPPPPGNGPQGYSRSSPRHPWSSSGLPCLPAAACSVSQTPPWPPAPPPGPAPGTGLWSPSLWPRLPRDLALPHSGRRCSSLPLTATGREAPG